MALVGSGMIGTGQSEHYRVDLRAGTTYRVYVAPSVPNVDFDLYVHDENGNLITYDESLDADALCQITPRWDGPFLMSVRSAAGAASYTISVQN